MSYIDPWQWFKDFQWQALSEGNFRYLRLPEIYHSGWVHLEAAQYEDAIRVFTEGIAVAQQMELPMWEFFFESWVCEVHVLASNYKEALNGTTRLVAKSVRPEHQDHPCRAVVYFTLAWVYFYLDMHGYEQPIRQALDTLETDMPLDEETHHRSIFLQADIAYGKEQYEDALAISDRYMNLVDGNPYRQASGYGLQRSVAYARGDLSGALSATHLREVAARDASLLNNAVDSALWSGIIWRYLGESDRATAIIQRGMDEYDALNLSKQSPYYHILAEYETACGNYDKALHLRDQQIMLASASGSLSNEFYARLDRCFLLNLMGQDAQDALQTTKVCANRSQQPDFFLQKLETAQAGRTMRHDWQTAYNG